MQFSMQFRRMLATLSGLGVFLLAACGSHLATAPSPIVSAPTGTPVAANNPPNNNHGGNGGQIVETGKYHLELVPKTTTVGFHLDFYLQAGENHAPVPNAKVTAQVLLPDGSQKSLEMKYDAEDKHYTVLLPSTIPGNYQVAILSDIRGEKVNGRFRFTQ
jgi:hypothetical protein